MSAELKPPRRRQGRITLAAILAVAAIVAAAVVYSSNSSADTTPLTESPATSAPIATVIPDDSDASPDACLGGDGRDAVMLLAAQNAAPHTTNGAIGLAASFVRWMQRLPLPSVEEGVMVQDAVLTRDRSFVADLPAYIASNPEFGSGLVEDGQDFYMSTIKGVWLLDSASRDAVTVSIGTSYVIEGALSPRFVSSVTIDMKWEDGAWKVGAADGERTTETLFAAGTDFVGGC